MCIRDSLVQSVQNDSTSQSGAGESILLGAEGEDIFDVINTVSMGVPYRLNFERANTIVFSKEAAEAGVLQRMTRVELNSLNIRQSVKLIVSLCPARSFLQGMAGAGMQNITKLQYSVYHSYVEDAATPMINYSLLHEAAEGERLDAAIALGGLDVSAVEQAKESAETLRSENAEKSGEGGGDSKGGESSEGENQAAQDQQGEKSEYTTEGVSRLGGMAAYAGGAALFSGWNMVGVLDNYDARFLLMGSGQFKHGWVRVPYKESELLVYLTSTGARKAEIDLTDSPHVNLEVYFTCEVLQDVEAYSREGWDQGLKSAAQAYIEEEILRVFALCQGLNSDAMGFGRDASKHFSTVGSWENYGWKERYKEMTLAVEVHLTPKNNNVTSDLK